MTSDAFEITEAQGQGQPANNPISQLAQKQPLSVSLINNEFIRPDLAQLINRLTEAETTNEELTAQARQKKRKLLLKLLVVVDSLDRIIRHTDIQNDAASSLQTLRTQFLQFLEDEDVSIVELKIGQLYDLNTCDITQKDVREDLPEGTILFIDQHGYFWQSGLLRKARITCSVKS